MKKKERFIPMSIHDQRASAVARQFRIDKLKANTVLIQFLINTNATTETVTNRMNAAVTALSADDSDEEEYIVAQVGTVGAAAAARLWAEHFQTLRSETDGEPS